jgi:hypothetical protein
MCRRYAERPNLSSQSVSPQCSTSPIRPSQRLHCRQSTVIDSRLNVSQTAVKCLPAVSSFLDDVAVYLWRAARGATLEWRHQYAEEVVANAMLRTANPQVAYRPWYVYMLPVPLTLWISFVMVLRWPWPVTWNSALRVGINSSWLDL